MRALTLVALVACAAGKTSALYTAELELCLERSKTCDEYVVCRREVAARYGRPFAGSCADGGK